MFVGKSATRFCKDWVADLFYIASIICELFYLLNVNRQEEVIIKFDKTENIN